MSWFDPCRQHASLGSTAERPGSLGGLAAARARNLAQFFTPDAVAALLWRIASPAMDAALARRPGARVALLDNSVGSGRLLQFADPDKHTLAGADVHGPSLDVLTDAAEAAGFRVDFVHAGMEAIEPHGFAVGLLNPPFSIHLDSPTLMQLPGNSYGTFGPASAAVSHRFAVEQALHACNMVLAIVPRSASALWLADAGYHDRLRAVLTLPAGSFREEGTDVAVDLVVFGDVREPAAPIELVLSSLDDALPDFDLHCYNTSEQHPGALSATHVQAGACTIKEPATGDNRVRIGHKSSRITLKFFDGLTRAMVENGLLRRPVRPPADNHRYPDGIRFAGQGQFDIELYLLQDDPMACLHALENRIRELGGTPVVDEGLRNYLRKRIRRHKRESTPYRHVVRAVGAQAAGVGTGALRAIPKRNRLVNPNKWGTSVLLKDVAYDVAVDGGDYVVTHPAAGEQLRLPEADFLASFALEGQQDTAGEWLVVHEGRVAAFPELAAAIRADMARLGVDTWLDRDYQTHDIAEMRMGRRGGCLAWVMALGKSRAALALALLGGERSLIVLEPQLIDEMRDEIHKIGLSADQWQVITRPEHCGRLRRVNIVSYNRLRRPISEGAGRRTYASLLRRRIGTLVADEGDVLTNHASQQSRAIAMVSPRRRYLLAGTPVRNMPRDILGVTTYVGGDGTALQPFGRHRPYADPVLHRNMDTAHTGARHFMDTHSVVEWVTHEFVDSGMVTGAKREVPKVRNIAQLRKFAAPLLKRRTQEEPEVARYIQIPKANSFVTTLEWDADHLRHYIEIADHFAAWYREARKLATGRATGLNLVALLARVGAVERANTCPQFATPGFGSYAPLTSKQRYLIDRMETLTNEGRKTLCFVEQPMMVNILVRELAKRGVEAVPFHGGIPIMARVKDMNRRFRQGSAPVMVATRSTCQAGYNIPQANYVLSGDRNWVARTEEQALYRVLRGEQKNPVDAEYVHLAGSIDIYQDQTVRMKKDTIGATIDFLVPQLQEAEFLHMDAIFDRFIEDLAARHGFTQPSKFREALKHAA